MCKPNWKPWISIALNLLKPWVYKQFFWNSWICNKLKPWTISIFYPTSLKVINFYDVQSINNLEFSSNCWVLKHACCCFEFLTELDFLCWTVKWCYCKLQVLIKFTITFEFSTYKNYEIKDFWPIVHTFFVLILLKNKNLNHSDSWI